MLVATALAAVSAGALVVAVTWAAQRDTRPGDEAGDVVKVGVVQGQSVPGYLRSARTEMSALTDPSAPAVVDTWALVSLDDYVPPGRLPELLDGSSVAQVYARVPLPGVLTQVVRIPAVRVPADVAAGMLDAALTRDQEQAEYLQLGRHLRGEAENDERTRRAYGTAAATAAAEAAAYRSFCACIFAAVVRAAPAGLTGIADRPGVRAVDPAPEVRRLDRAEFRPPLPEQVGTVPAAPGESSMPASASTGAVPTGTSGIASRTFAPILSSLGAAVTSASSQGADPGLDPAVTALEERAAVLSASEVSAAQDVSTGSSGASTAPSGR
ncbi:hypothetical protein ACWKSP_22550 [Micromonosporaceae bacterium Da 78-11]